jgi:ketosteroid isomerase-like protein
MMTESVVKEIYQRFSDGDIDGFLKLCADNIEWVVNGPASLEKCSTFHGIDGVRTFLSILDRTWSFSSFTPREFISGGSKVVVLGEETGTDRASGQMFENRWAHVFTVRDQKILTFREFLCHWLGNQRPPKMGWQ